VVALGGEMARNGWLRLSIVLSVAWLIGATAFIYYSAVSHATKFADGLRDFCDMANKSLIRDSPEFGPKYVSDCGAEWP
jgi:hypothetical protein